MTRPRAAPPLPAPELLRAAAEAAASKKALDMVGLDLTGLDGPIGRLYLQFGSTIETIVGTTIRSPFDGAVARTGSTSIATPLGLCGTRR